MRPALRRRSEIQYQKNLSAIAGRVSEIVTGFYDGSETSSESVIRMLTDYSGALDDWSALVANKMFLQVEREEWNQWKSVSEKISESLRDVIGNTPVGHVAQNIMYRQIELMKSLPLEAAERIREIQDRAMQAVASGERPDAMYQMIMESGNVAAGRARMIGSGTRPSHKKMRDKFVYWHSPPTLDGLTGHAGCLPNCQCWQDVHVPNARK